MTTRVWTALAVTAIAVTGVTIDLKHQARAAHRLRSDGVTAAVPSSRTFSDPGSGISLSYPAAWHHQPCRTAELSVAAPAGRAVVSLDVPVMGWHPPFIPIGIVSSRYVDDLRQNTLADAAVRDTADLKVAGATARRTTCRGHGKDGSACIDTAVVVVHGGQVYILSCDSDDAGEPTARRALDAVIASVRWTK